MTADQIDGWDDDDIDLTDEVSETWPPVGNGCICFQVPERYWTRYGDAVEPGSQVEWNPECPQHPVGCAHGHVTGDPGDGLCHDCGLGGL